MTLLLVVLLLSATVSGPAPHNSGGVPASAERAYRLTWDANQFQFETPDGDTLVLTRTPPSHQGMAGASSRQSNDRNREDRPSTPGAAQAQHDGGIIESIWHALGELWWYLARWWGAVLAGVLTALVYYLKRRFPKLFVRVGREAPTAEN